MLHGQFAPIGLLIIYLLVHPIMSDKEMRKTGKGIIFEVTSDFPECNIVLVERSNDKATNNLASNFITSREVGRVTFRDKREKLFVKIEMPEIV